MGETIECNQVVRLAFCTPSFACLAGAKGRALLPGKHKSVICGSVGTAGKRRDYYRELPGGPVGNSVSRLMMGVAGAIM